MLRLLQLNFVILIVIFKKINLIKVLNNSNYLRKLNICTEVENLFILQMECRRFISNCNYFLDFKQFKKNIHFVKNSKYLFYSLNKLDLKLKNLPKIFTLVPPLI